MIPGLNALHVFRDRELPEGAKLVGYAAWGDAYGVDVPVRYAGPEMSLWITFVKKNSGHCPSNDAKAIPLHCAIMMSFWKALSARPQY